MLFLKPPYISKCSYSLTLFLSASLSLTSILSLTSVSYPPNFSMDSIFSWGSSYILQYFIDYAIPPYSSSRPFVTFSHTAPSALAGTSFWACSLLCISFSTFSGLYMLFKWVNSQFCSSYCITRSTWASYPFFSLLQICTAPAVLPNSCIPFPYFSIF